MIVLGHPPPGPERLVSGRYTHRVAIANSRLTRSPMVR